MLFKNGTHRMINIVKYFSIKNPTPTKTSLGTYLYSKAEWKE